MRRVTIDVFQLPSIGLHDVWVEHVQGQWQALLPYWDAGYIMLNVDDPANPVFLGGSDYPLYDPPVRDENGDLAAQGNPYEGNAHAGVFGGSDGEYLFVGDEDFDPVSTSTQINGVDVEIGGATFGGPADSLTGTLIDTGSTGCAAGDVDDATASGQIAMIDRGGCFFSIKVYCAQLAGYEGVVIANNLAGDGVFTMGAGDFAELVTIPSVMISYEDVVALRIAAGGAEVLGTITVNEIYNGWGYLRVLDNTHDTITLDSNGRMPGGSEVDVGYLGELGYYAPAETLEPGFYDPLNPIGDLTMHNVEVDPSTQDIVASYDGGPRMFVSWYSLGMRAVEYRPEHFHNNANDEGSYSWNVHEAGRFIAEDGSNFWGVHVDTIEVETDDGIQEQQVILASDRNTGLWIFTFGCESSVPGDGSGTPFYCRRETSGG
jgi:uncharacterized protein YodC (DUF2158 family)